MKFNISNKSLALGNLVEDYGDVELHYEDSLKGQKCFSSLKANKVILALYSPYFHRLFQGSKGLSVFHICFVGVNNNTINDVIKLIYGQSITIQEKHVSRFENLLKWLEIDYEKEILSESSNVNDDESVHQQVGKKLKLSSQQSDQPDKISLDMDPPPTTKTKTQGELLKAKVDEQEAGTSLGTNTRKVGRCHPPQSEPQIIQEEQEITREYIDKYFETTESGLAEELDKFDFKLGTRSSEDKHLEYTCSHCGLVLKALHLAREHFVAYHQERDVEIKKLKECFEYSTRVSNDISFIQESMKAKYNETMVHCQLENIVNELGKRVTLLKNIQEKNLLPHLMRKRDEYIERFSKKMTIVRHMLDTVNKQLG